jgi:hypothetical protein
MEFLLIDVGATLALLLGYLAIVARLPTLAASE